MKHHRCQPPPRHGAIAFWVCPECRCAWHLHPTVAQWFRTIP